jgi:hypothetical protein
MPLLLRDKMTCASSQEDYVFDEMLLAVTGYGSSQSGVKVGGYIKCN